MSVRDRGRRRGIAAIAAMAAALSALIPAASAAALTTEEILNYQGIDRAQVLLDGAKKEGEVVLYSGIIVNQALRPIAEAFMQAYPFLKLTYLRADSEELVAKLTAEVRANNVVADLAEGTGIAEEAIGAGIVQPFSTPVLATYPERYRDPNHLWAPTRLSYFSIAYNTKLVPPDKVPKTYADLLDPQWKGKMAWPFRAATGTDLFVTNLRMAWGDDKAMDYFKVLAGQGIINFASGSARTLVDRVIAGEYPIALAIYAHHPLISAGKGAPVNSQLMDPVASAAGTIVAVKGMKHPYAAMLLVDFVLSEKGQQILAAAEYFPARPDVAPLPQLAAVVPQKAGFTENFIGPDAMNKFTPGTEAIVQELFR